MKFIDEIQITIKSGKGGPGAKSFRREKFVPRGGPDGGDGGKGGDVIFRANPRLLSLLDLRTKSIFKADDGAPGGPQHSSGLNGADMVLDVPPGTIIMTQNGEVLADLTEPGVELVFLKGGRGGKGNAFFKTSVNQAPTHFQPGEAGESRDIRLELKLLANVGIIGFPNAGKSTLISRISAARPKIADYPFTTLVPNLGVVRIDSERTLVVADIPGLIPGAHKGEGLGIKFLKHVERTSCFIHLIDVSGVSGRDPLDDYRAINAELKEYDSLYNEEGETPLSLRKQVVVLNKIDSLADADLHDVVARFKKQGIETLQTSSATGQGIQELLYKIGEMVLGQN